MKNSYKLAVFDIDGVLNEHGGNILDESIEAIKMLRARGIRVCFASGKHAWYVQGGLVWSGLLTDDTLIVAENGGVIYDPYTRRTILEDKYISDIHLLKSIFRNLHSRDEGFAKFAGLTVWEEPKETLFCLFPKRASEVEKLGKVLREIVALNELHLTVVNNPDSVDVLQSGINKATGLKYICDWLSVNMREIIAFGDSYNDLEMLRAVGLPITLENGVNEAKKVVTERGGIIAKDRCGRGVLEVVEKMIKEKLI